MKARRGFTLVELLVVMFVLAILIALLLPAINGAVRSARNATVTAEINQMATALADFKSKFGTYPPSRIMLSESGWYNTEAGNTPLAATQFFGNEVIYAGNNDLTHAELAERSIASLLKIWPRIQENIRRGPVPPKAEKVHDFRGLGMGGDPARIYLEGHECLVFFLGGIPVPSSFGGPATVGFANNPRNPFLNADNGPNRVAPMMEFNPGRLVDSDNDGMPGYVDPLGAAGDRRYYAYFSSYGGNGYDPNDVNLSGSAIDTTEASETMSRPYRVNFKANLVTSVAPNPYTTGLPAYVPPPGGDIVSTAFVKPDSFQIISAGRDARYGPGGRYSSDDLGEKVPGDGSGANQIQTGQRISEQDNLTNFATGPLQ